MELKKDLVELYVSRGDLAKEIICRDLKTDISRLFPEELANYLDDIYFMPKEKIYVLKFTFQIKG